MRKKPVEGLAARIGTTTTAGSPVALSYHHHHQAAAAAAAIVTVHCSSLGGYSRVLRVASKLSSFYVLQYYKDPNGSSYPVPC